MNETNKDTLMAERHLRVKEERKRLGLTQQEAADICGVHRVQWGRYERGEQGFNGTSLNKFAEAGADPVYILTGLRQDAQAQALFRANMLAPYWRDGEEVPEDERFQLALNAEVNRRMQQERRELALLRSREAVRAVVQEIGNPKLLDLMLLAAQMDDDAIDVAAGALRELLRKK